MLLAPQLTIQLARVWRYHRQLAMLSRGALSVGQPLPYLFFCFGTYRDLFEYITIFCDISVHDIIYKL